MKNMSIRWRILAGIITINLIGMITVGIYLHESYSGELDIAAQQSATLGVATWNQVSALAADEFGPATDVESALKYVETLKEITGADYGVLIDKTAVDEKAYAAQLETVGMPNNWDERENYVLIASTDPALSDGMKLDAPSDGIPESGKIIGVERAGALGWIGAVDAWCSVREKPTLRILDSRLRGNDETMT